MPVIDFPISLDTEHYKVDSPLKVQGVLPSVLTGEDRLWTGNFTYRTASGGLLFPSKDLVPLAPDIYKSLSFPIQVQGIPPQAVIYNLALQGGLNVPISNNSYSGSAASGLAFAGMRPVGDTTLAITLPAILLTESDKESVIVKIYCGIDKGNPSLFVKGNTGISYSYQLPNDLPYVAFNFAVTAPGGAVVPYKRLVQSTDLVRKKLSIFPGGGSGASLQLTTVLYTRPYTDSYTLETGVTDSIEIIYTLADPIDRRSSSSKGYDFKVNNPETCNGIDTVEIKANLSWSEDQNVDSTTPRKTYQMSTVLPGGIPYNYYSYSANSLNIYNKVKGFLENAGKWTTTFTNATQDDMKKAKFMSILLSDPCTIVYPATRDYLFESVTANLVLDYSFLTKYGLCHEHPCARFNPEGLFYTPVEFKSGENYNSSLQDMTSVHKTVGYVGVPGKPSIFSSSPGVDSHIKVNDTDWRYHSGKNDLLPGVGATGAYGLTNHGSITPTPTTLAVDSNSNPNPGYLDEYYFRDAGPAAIVINL